MIETHETQSVTPEKVFDDKAELFIANQLREAGVLLAKVDDDTGHLEPHSRLVVSSGKKGTLSIMRSKSAISEGRSTRIGFQPEGFETETVSLVYNETFHDGEFQPDGKEPAMYDSGKFITGHAQEQPKKLLVETLHDGYNGHYRADDKASEVMAKKTVISRKKEIAIDPNSIDKPLVMVTPQVGKALV